jgi:diaminopimelate decarboxylase
MRSPRRYGTPLYTSTMRGAARAIAACAEGRGRASRTIFYSIKANPNPAVAAVLVARAPGSRSLRGRVPERARRPVRSERAHPVRGPRQGRRRTRARGRRRHRRDPPRVVRGDRPARRRRGPPRAEGRRVDPRQSGRSGARAVRCGWAAARRRSGSTRRRSDEVVGPVAGARQPRAHRRSSVRRHADPRRRVLGRQWAHGLASRAASRAAYRPAARDDRSRRRPRHSLLRRRRPLDLPRLAAIAAELRAQLRAEPLLAQARVIVEPGRFLAGPAGATSRADRGEDLARQRFVVADGGMHHHLAASGNLGQVIKRDYPIVAAGRFADDPAPRSPDGGRTAMHAARHAGARRGGAPRSRTGRSGGRPAIRRLRALGEPDGVSEPATAGRSPGGRLAASRSAAAGTCAEARPRRVSPRPIP